MEPEERVSHSCPSPNLDVKSVPGFCGYASAGPHPASIGSTVLAARASTAGAAGIYILAWPWICRVGPLWSIQAVAHSVSLVWLVRTFFFLFFFCSFFEDEDGPAWEAKATFTVL